MKRIGVYLVCLLIGSTTAGLEMTQLEAGCGSSHETPLKRQSCIRTGMTMSMLYRCPNVNQNCFRVHLRV